jgi:tetratricopeptide (TPR) repeat protein
VPPALLHEPDELLEASQVLTEFPTPVGAVLWQSVRDVTLWAETPFRDRAWLFGDEAAARRLNDLLASGAEPALEVSLTTLAALVGAPGSANPDIVALVCQQVSQWAEARGAWGTAMAYAQAGALATPLEPEAALFAGGLALRWRRSARAETWLRRAIGLARRLRNWGAYAQAYVYMGIIYERRGQVKPAHRYFGQGLRAARRHSLSMVRGAAFHGLLRLALEEGKLEEAERFARGAMRAFGRGNPRLPELVHDVAYLQVQRENYIRAIPLLTRLLPSRVEPVERAHTLAILARAAAGDDNMRLYQEAWMDAWSIINRVPGEAERHGRALLELARASTLCRDWTHVEQAVRAASLQRDPALAAQVRELAQALRERHGSALRLRRGGHRRTIPKPSEMTDAEAIAASMRARKAALRGRPPRAHRPRGPKVRAVAEGTPPPVVAPPPAQSLAPGPAEARRRRGKAPGMAAAAKPPRTRKAAPSRDDAKPGPATAGKGEAKKKAGGRRGPPPPIP